MLVSWFLQLLLVKKRIKKKRISEGPSPLIGVVPLQTRAPQRARGPLSLISLQLQSLVSLSLSLSLSLLCQSANKNKAEGRVA